MIITKKIFNRSRGMDDEDFAVLTYDTTSHKFTVIKTSSYKQPGSLKWKEEETIYELEKYLVEFPEHKNTVLSLQSAILSE